MVFFESRCFPEARSNAKTFPSMVEKKISPSAANNVLPIAAEKDFFQCKFSGTFMVLSQRFVLAISPPYMVQFFELLIGVRPSLILIFANENDKKISKTKNPIRRNESTPCFSDNKSAI